MDAAAATEYAESRAMTLSPEEFELLCKSVLSESLPSTRFSVTASRQGGGIGIDGHIRGSLLDVSLGVRAEWYGSNNTVGSPKIQRFQGTLAGIGCGTGTVITASSPTTPTVKSVERTGIHLVNGLKLFDSMTDLHVGVRRQSIRFEPGEKFWSLFGEPGKTGVISSKRVPLANSLEILDIILSAIDNARDEKDDIVESAGMPPRHVDPYAIADWVLGFVHQEWPGEKSHRQRRWSLTRSGARYVVRRAAGLDDEAKILLLDGVRNVEIIGRLVNSLSESGSLEHSDLVDFAASESELSRSSARRRGNPVGIWLA